VVRPAWLAEVARARLQEQLAALMAHEAGARLGEDPEDVHQMRVATRRLRAALRLFQEVLPPGAEALRDELAWIARALGEVRDLDVQIESVARAGCALGAEPSALGPVLYLFEARRSAARETLHAALEAERYVALVASLQDLAVQTWPDTSYVGLVEITQLVQRRYQRLRKAGEQLHAEASAAALHRARIRTKQFRYALEPLRGVYGRRARRLIRRAVRLQDLLGTAQDAAVLGEQLRLASQPDHGLLSSSIFLLGQLCELYAERIRDARSSAPEAYRRLVGRAWKRLKRRARRLAASTEHA
jgi:triphosphatase